jgi:hypothetical protein
MQEALPLIFLNSGWGCLQNAIVQNRYAITMNLVASGPQLEIVLQSAGKMNALDKRVMSQFL